ncbi:MAG: iron-sulfur cluster repair di-iron protein [Planctomycetota bacterium]
MEQLLTEQTTVGELAGKCPRARKVFEQRGIDYCCGGKRSLAEAAKEQGTSPDELLSDLKMAIEEKPDQETDEKDWYAASLSELADHIQSRHHTFMHEQLPRLAAMLAKVIRAHEANHGKMLRELQKTYLGLRVEIEEHLYKEERILFPLIRSMDAYAQDKGPRPVAHCGTVQNPIGQMEHEHDDAAHALDKMREITVNYTLPGDACNTFAALYDVLQAMEDDLHQHIHLENNILFPRSAELERTIGGE